jgi:predicted RNA-binding Zn-ribbon protein involved in translation (DUF1610 family)
MTTTLERVSRSIIIMCPTCGEHLKLCSIVPEEANRQRMTFKCECGFNYRQSSAVTAERGL